MARIKGMVDIRNAYQEVIAIQRHYDYDKKTFNHLLGKLNRTYNSFVKHYGYLNSAVNRNLLIVMISIRFLLVWKMNVWIQVESLLSILNPLLLRRL